MITGLAHVCLLTPDLPATERFYCEGLGLAKQFEFIRAGRVFGFYLKVGPRNFIEVFETDAGVESADRFPIRHIAIEVDDLAATRQRLIDHGYTVTEPLLAGDNAWQAWVTDPAGVQIEFHHYTPEASQLTGAPCLCE